MKVEYIDKGGHELHRIDGKMMVCVSCGKPKEYSKDSHLCNHKCSTAHENRRIGTHRAAYLHTDYSHKPAFGERLGFGYKILNGDQVY